MSDQTNEEATVPVSDGTAAQTDPQATAPAAESITMPGIAAPENAQIGDENIAPVFEAEVDVNTDSVPAQTTGPAAVPVEEVYVHETSVKLDRVITDPHSPEAVQIPDAGRGSLALPIHDLSKGTVEDFFAEHGQASE